MISKNPSAAQKDIIIRLAREDRSSFERIERYTGLRESEVMIADDLAFANRHHLSRLFSESMGEPPGQGSAFLRRRRAMDFRG